MATTDRIGDEKAMTHPPAPAGPVAAGPPVQRSAHGDGPFASSYAEARGHFLAAAAASGLPVESWTHPLAGRDGETLAMDVVVDGNPQARDLLILSSGCHGVEGYCGSGVQVDALQDTAARATAADRDVTVLHIHALNPYGFSHLRRTTHENIDLNRNFQDFGKPLPLNEGYGMLHPLLIPPSWPPDAENTAQIQAAITALSLPRYQAAITRGQHAFADGLFYGGVAPAWSNRILRQVLRRHAAAARRIAWIDLHSGLGPSGVGERIFACRDDSSALARARAWWGTDVTSIYDGSSASAFLTGLMWQAAYDECPDAEYTGIALEYGTVPITEVLHALRGDQWLANHPEAPVALAESIKRQLFAAFQVDSVEWRAAVLRQAREATRQAIDGLVGSR